MPMSDIQLVFQWWSALFLVGAAAFPLTKRLFAGPPRVDSPRSVGAGEASPRVEAGWYDKGYFFSKAVGMAVVSYIVFLLGTLRIAPFTFFTVIGAMIALFVLGILLSDRTYWTDWTNKTKRRLQFFSFARPGLAKLILYITLEEVIFFVALLFWSWVKAHEPSIRGLEKFMDYGFMQSILNTQWFPAPDMWWQGGFINYYYFGHLVTAVLTKLSGLDLSVTFNLMLATLFALTLTMSFSIGVQLVLIGQTRQIGHIGRIGRIKPIVGGALTAFLVTLAGNMQTLYAFTKGYLGDNVVAFWTILWAPSEFLTRIGEGLNRYWYANATRFIPFTIHEFPSYSFVVSDVHGHVLSIPFVLLTIALFVKLFTSEYTADPQETKRLRDKEIKIFGFLNLPISLSPNLIFLGFLLGILLMTNALDGPIYFLLLACVLVTKNAKCPACTCLRQEPMAGRQMPNAKCWKEIGLVLGLIGFSVIITALPFLWHFKSFAAGIGVNCPPGFLANTKIGPFLFEGVDKCQKSPLWMMELLWGFFWYAGVWLFLRRMWGKDEYDGPVNRILKVFFLFGLALIIIPEFFYVKDIYPAHFRSNTMFKLGYQAFILWSITAAYVIVHFLFQRDNPRMPNAKCQMLNKYFKLLRLLFFILLIPQLFLVSIYPLFSVRSYFGELRTYKSIYGLEWLEKEFPDDWKAIEWLRQTIREKQGSPSTEFTVSVAEPLRTTITDLSVIVEADGDSYTDYNHISAFSGIPSVVGWAVHEWLWRGSYDIVAPRREDVRMIYESGDSQLTQRILEKYNVRYIVIGRLEREKFKNLQEDKFRSFGFVAFQSGDTAVWELHMEE